MPLPSQLLASGSHRQHMVSRRRSRSRWQYFALVLVILAFVIYFAVLRGGQDEPMALREPPFSKSMVPHRDSLVRQPSVMAVGQFSSPAREAPEATESEAHASAAPLSDPVLKQANTSDPVATAAMSPADRHLRMPVQLFRSPANEIAAAGMSSAIHLSDAAMPKAHEIARGMALIESGRRIEGRLILSELLLSEPSSLTAGQSAAIRSTLTAVNTDLVFSKRLIVGDPLVATYIVKEGNQLDPIARMYHIPYQLIEKINQVKARRIHPGLQLKIIKGPIHAVVDKSEFIMDTFVSVPDHGRVYIRSFPVGLGAENSTPLGSWLVSGRKVANPAWTNPWTGKVFSADDPQNPIGEYWIGLDGTDADNKDLRGYGIHGTIKPETVGTQSSMGCVRLVPQDIEMIFHMLIEGQSEVEIRG